MELKNLKGGGCPQPKQVSGKFTLGTTSTNRGEKPWADLGSFAYIET